MRPTTRSRCFRSARRAAMHREGPVSRRRSVAREPRVELQVDSGARGRPRDRLEVLDRGDRDLDVLGDGGRPVSVNRVEPAQDRSDQAVGPEGERLVEAGDTQALGAGRQRGAGHGAGAVPEAVCLDHRHQTVGDASREEPGVGGDGLQVDGERRPPPGGTGRGCDGQVRHGSTLTGGRASGPPPQVPKLCPLVPALVPLRVRSSP